MSSPRRRLLGITLIEVGVIAVVVTVIALILMPFKACACASPRLQCVVATKQIGLSEIMYANNNDGRLPIADRWMTVIEPLMKNRNLLHDRDLPKKEDYGRAFRHRLSGVVIDDVRDPKQFIMSFDSDLTGRNANSELWSLPRPGRHNGSDSILFADGHAKSISFRQESSNDREILSADDKSGPVGSNKR